jgi:hypothetical protein
VINEAVDWLPDNVFTEEAVRPLFVGLLDAWSRTWFVDALISIKLRTPADGRAAATQRLVFASELGSIELTARVKRNLVVVALGGECISQTLTQADRHILDVFATEICEDLVSRLNKEFAGKVTQAGKEQIGLDVRLAGNEVLVVNLSCALVGSYLKLRIEKPNRTRVPLVSRTKALGRSRTTVVGVLGYADLTLSELAGLDTGDVLVLDRSLSDPVELKMPQSNRVVARGKLQHDNGKTSIQL